MCIVLIQSKRLTFIVIIIECQYKMSNLEKCLMQCSIGKLNCNEQIDKQK